VSLIHLLLALLACVATPALGGVAGEARDWPRVVALEFEGNRVTREETLLREIDLRVGDRADPEAIERSRQAILDLGLFRKVAIDSLPDPRGVRLRVKLDEKRYVLPIPRIDASSDGDYGYGGQLRWNNVGGRNHTLNVYAERGRFPDDVLRESERSARVAYRAPYVFDSRFGVDGLVERIERQTPGEQGAYEQTLDRLQLIVDRDFSTGLPRRGWRLGGGLFHQRQDTAGEFAPAPDGEATALVGIADYRDLRFHVRSETGSRFAARVEVADEAWSDYDYRLLQLDYANYRQLGQREHQSLHLLAEGGIRQGGPRSRNAFFLGGSSRLRGYPSQYLAGERYYRVSAEVLRPLRWDWLRLVAMVEAGGTGGDIEGRSPAGPHASVGLGLRIRPSRFVGVEIELGIAVPLKGGSGLEFFAGGL